MYEHKISSFDQSITIIHPGEYLASGDDIIISTVLGSCVAVALHDKNYTVGGLNHFMLPGSFPRVMKDKEYLAEPNALYGMYAMELLINDILKFGCKKENLRAKVFGGAFMFGVPQHNHPSVSESNIRFALNYLETEGIPVITTDLGGTQARKLFFFVRQGRVLLKRLGGTMAKVVEQAEDSYRARIVSNSQPHKAIVFTNKPG